MAEQFDLDDLSIDETPDGIVPEGDPDGACLKDDPNHPKYDTAHGGVEPSSANHLWMRLDCVNAPWSDFDALNHLRVTPRQLYAMKHRLLALLSRPINEKECQITFLAWRHITDEHYTLEYEDEPQILFPLPDIDRFPILVYESSYAEALRDELLDWAGLESSSGMMAKRRWQLFIPWIVRLIRDFVRADLLWKNDTCMEKISRDACKSICKMASLPKGVINARKLKPGDIGLRLTEPNTTAMKHSNARASMMVGKVAEKKANGAGVSKFGYRKRKATPKASSGGVKAGSVKKTGSTKAASTTKQARPAKKKITTDKSGFPKANG